MSNTFTLSPAPPSRKRRGRHTPKRHPRSVRKFHRRMISLLKTRDFAGKNLYDEVRRMRSIGTPYSPPLAPPTAVRSQLELVVHGTAPGHNHKAPLLDAAPVSSFKTRKMQHQLESKAAREAKHTSRQQAKNAHSGS